MKFGLAITSMLVLGVGTASASPSVPSDARASDSVALFSSFCVATGGVRDRALSVLGNGNALATRLPDDFVRRLQLGRDGGVAWAIRSPNDAQILLEYEARGICAVRIADAEKDAVKEAFGILAHQVAAGAEIMSKPDEVTNVAGVPRTYSAYSFVLNGRTVIFALSSMDRRVDEEQHLLTFGYLAEKGD